MAVDDLMSHLEKTPFTDLAKELSARWGQPRDRSYLSLLESLISHDSPPLLMSQGVNEFLIHEHLRTKKTIRMDFAVTDNFLKAKYADGASPAVHLFKDQERLAKYDVLTVKPGFSHSIIDQGKNFCDETFPLEPGASAIWAKWTRAIADSDPCLIIGDSEPVAAIERSLVKIYMTGERIAAVSGIYQSCADLVHPMYWGGRWGVRADLQNTLAAATVMVDIKNSLQRMQAAFGGENAMYIFTLDSEENWRVQELYENLGFEQMPLYDEYNGQLERVYRFDMYEGHMRKVNAIEKRLRREIGSQK